MADKTDRDIVSPSAVSVFRPHTDSSRSWDFSPPSRRSWRNTTSVDESPSIQETEFRRALDEFAGAEMRLGK